MRQDAAGCWTLLSNLATVAWLLGPFCCLTKLNLGGVKCLFVVLQVPLSC